MFSFHFTAAIREFAYARVEQIHAFVRYVSVFDADSAGTEPCLIQLVRECNFSTNWHDIRFDVKGYICSFNLRKP